MPVSLFVVDHMNKHTNTSGPKQKFPTATHLGEDMTPSTGPVALDEHLLDSDVIQIIQTAHPHSTLQEIAKHKKIMRTFFTDVEHGKLVIESHLTGEPLFWKQEMGAEEEEDSDDEEDSDEEKDSDEESDGATAGVYQVCLSFFIDSLRGLIQNCYFFCQDHFTCCHY